MNRRYRSGKRGRRKKPYRTNTTMQIVIGVLLVLGLFGLLHELGITRFLGQLLGLFVVIAVIVISVRYYLKIQSRKTEGYKHILTPHLGYMRNMDPFEFEGYVAEVFQRQGYQAKAVQGRGDNGIDIWMTHSGRRFVVQVKRYQEKNSVGEPEVRNFFGSYAAEHDIFGYFVTTSHYTKQARVWAEKHKHRLRLIDGNELVHMVANLPYN